MSGDPYMQSPRQGTESFLQHHIENLELKQTLKPWLFVFMFLSSLSRCLLLEEKGNTTCPAGRRWHVHHEWHNNQKNEKK